MIFQNIGSSFQFLRIFAFIYQLLMIDFKILNEQTCFIEMISKINFFLISQNLEAATYSRSGKEVFLGSRELFLRNAYGRGYFQSNVAQCFLMTLPIFKFLVFCFFGLESLSDRCWFRKVTFFYKIVKGLYPRYLTMYVNLKSTSHYQTRSANKSNLQEFSCRDAESVKKFKSMLKIFFL